MERMLALERGHHVKKLASSDNALSVLQCEAGLTEDTAKVLRKAVSAELAVPRPGEASEASLGGSRKRAFDEAKARQKAYAEVRRSQGPRCPEPCPSTCPRASSPRCARRAALKAEIDRSHTSVWASGVQGQLEA